MIKIVQQINDSNKVKIIEIPDIQYHIEHKDCSIGEMIIENYRTWE